MTKGEKLGVITLIFTIIGTILVLCFDPFNWFYNREIYRNELGGSMKATYKTHHLNNGETKTIVVCLKNDNTISLKDLSLTPIFENSEMYSLKDFSLSFEVECFDVTLTPSTYFDVYEHDENKWLYKYNEDILEAFNKTRSPFSRIQLNGSKGHCFIKSKATYNGIPSQFEFSTDVWFFVVPDWDHLPFDEWMMECEKLIVKQIKMNSCDVYYYAEKYLPVYQYNVALDRLRVYFSSIEGEEINYKVGMGNNLRKVPAFFNSADSSIFDLAIARCKITRTDSTISYFLTYKPDYIKPGLYLLEGRCKADSWDFDKYDYATIHIDRFQDSARVSVKYNDSKAPEIDMVSLYPQSFNEDVIGIEQKDFTYIIKNKTEYVVICMVRYLNNSVKQLELDGFGETSLESIGISPIEVYQTDRKTPAEHEKMSNWKRILLLVLLAVCFIYSFFRLMVLTVNITDFFIALFSKKVGFRKAIDESILSSYRKRKEKRNIVIGFILTVITIIT